MIDAISKRGPASGDRRAFPMIRLSAGLISLGFLLFLFAAAADAQLAPIKPPTGWPQVPSGTGACSVEKSCAELTPAMVESALGPSPLERSLRQIARFGQGSRMGPGSLEPGVMWAVEALRQAGVDRVRTEKFALPTGAPAEMDAVIGEIRGRERPDEFVVLGAHLDVGSPENDALDDPADAAVVIDAARVVNATGTVPRRSIRVLLFIGTRQGKPGSRAYVAAHGEELDRTNAAIFFSVGAAPVTGYSLGGRKDILAAVREALAPVRSLGVKEFTLDAQLRPDNLGFLLEGIPTLVANENLENRVPGVRTDTGTLDPATLGELKRHVAIAAVTAYALADAPQRVGRRQSRAEVEQLMKDTGLEQEMRLAGLWPAWESAERGRRP